MKQDLEREVCAVICQEDGIRARDIAARLGTDRKSVNQVLYGSPLLKELCWQDRDFLWHGIVKQERPHIGLQEFSGWYGSVSAFLELSGDRWLEQLENGCRNIGRNLNDTRGLIHSFRDCRNQMQRLFRDLLAMQGSRCLQWELVFELRLKRARTVRIYADVLVITEEKVFSLEFKMKNTETPEEIQQAAKYAPFLEILFGPAYEILPVLVLTTAFEQFRFEPVGNLDMVLPVCSGDMLYNVFDAYMGFLKD